MNDTPRKKMPDRKIWERLLYMVFCAIAWSIAELLIGLVAIFQFICVLVNGHVHERALTLGRNLNSYAFQVFQFVTFNDERVPFPFSEWPDETVGETPWRRQEPEPVYRTEVANSADADARPETAAAAETAADDAQATPEPGSDDGPSIPSSSADETVRRDRGEPDGA